MQVEELKLQVKQTQAGLYLTPEQSFMMEKCKKFQKLENCSCVELTHHQGVDFNQNLFKASLKKRLIATSF